MKTKTINKLGNENKTLMKTKKRKTIRKNKKSNNKPQRTKN